LASSQAVLPQLRPSVAPRSIPDADIAPAIGIDMERSCPPFDDLSIDHNLADTDKARQLEHGIEQDRFEDRPQPAGPGFP
jgi:hypothetical protein